MGERDRALVNGMRTSISAKDGRLLGHLDFGRCAVHVGDDRAPGGPGDGGSHVYRAPDDCALDDPKAWAAANPGLAAGIKSVAYMEDEARRVLLTPSDQAHFRAFDLNQPQSPSREMICSVTDWHGCVVPVEDLPPRDGRCVLGLTWGAVAVCRR